MSAAARPASESPAAGPRQQDDRLITARDLAFFVYYYPLRWMTQILGDRFFWLILTPAQMVCQLVQRRDRQKATSKMMTMLGVPLSRARQLARQFLNHRARTALFVLRLRRNRGTPIVVRWIGREHLEQSLDQKRGVVLVTLHCLAKREARIAMQQSGREFRPVIHAAQRGFLGHGRLLKRFTRPRLLALQLGVGGNPIVRHDSDAILQIANTLREGRIVLMCPDVPNSSTAVDVQFMGRPWRMSAGVLDIARLTGCPVVPMWTSFERHGCVVEFREPLRLASGGSREEFTRKNLPVLIQAMEEQLTAHPDQWDFWDRKILAL